LLETVFLVLATSGIRYIECINFLKSYEESKFTMHNGFVSYNVSELRHSKNINNIYLPMFVYRKLKRVKYDYGTMRLKLMAKGCSFPPKYFRKWHYNFMLYHNVPESVADFMQGRANKSIASNHYLARSQQADFWYEKVVLKLQNLFK
jgi:intergrase/recombinase